MNRPSLHETRAKLADRQRQQSGDPPPPSPEAAATRTGRSASSRIAPNNNNAAIAEHLRDGTQPSEYRLIEATAANLQEHLAQPKNSEMAR
jgi:hypothetical protein